MNNDEQEESFALSLSASRVIGNEVSTESLSLLEANVSNSDISIDSEKSSEAERVTRKEEKKHLTTPVRENTATSVLSSTPSRMSFAGIQKNVEDLPGAWPAPPVRKYSGPGCVSKIVCFAKETPGTKEVKIITARPESVSADESEKQDEHKSVSDVSSVRTPQKLVLEQKEPLVEGRITQVYPSEIVQGIVRAAIRKLSLPNKPMVETPIVEGVIKPCIEYNVSTEDFVQEETVLVDKNDVQDDISLQMDSSSCCSSPRFSQNMALDVDEVESIDEVAETSSIHEEQEVESVPPVSITDEVHETSQETIFQSPLCQSADFEAIDTSIDVKKNTGNADDAAGTPCKGPSVNEICVTTPILARNDKIVVKPIPMTTSGRPSFQELPLSNFTGPDSSRKQLQYSDNNSAEPVDYVFLDVVNYLPDDMVARLSASMDEQRKRTKELEETNLRLQEELKNTNERLSIATASPPAHSIIRSSTHSHSNGKVVLSAVSSRRSSTTRVNVSTPIKEKIERFEQRKCISNMQSLSTNVKRVPTGSPASNSTTVQYIQSPAVAVASSPATVRNIHVIDANFLLLRFDFCYVGKWRVAGGRASSA